MGPISVQPSGQLSALTSAVSGVAGGNEDGPWAPQLGPKMSWLTSLLTWGGWDSTLTVVIGC